jgi:probable biosynthetic protein (TIGR04098 family)
MPEQSVLTRTEVIRPAMCGYNSLFVGQIGDWTWDAVSELCGTDVLTARTTSGAPAYLSFYYYRIRGSRRFHVRTPTFGDRVRIATRLFGFGSESVLTLHRLWLLAPGRPLPDPGDALDPDTFYQFDDADCLYVENFNRWVTRTHARSNADLVRSSPPGFRHAHLPILPAGYSPRVICKQARARLSFLDPSGDGYRPAETPFRVRYRIDPSRDLNGAGLLYFATYFAIVDWALLRLWNELGRDDVSFLDRVVVDQQLCYLGNADAGSIVDVTVARHEASGGGEAFDVVLHEHGSDRLLAVCTLRLPPGEQRVPPGQLAVLAGDRR